MKYLVTFSLRRWKSDSLKSITLKTFCSLIVLYFPSGNALTVHLFGEDANPTAYIVNPRMQKGKHVV